MLTNAGQQEVVIFLPCSCASSHSAASAAAVISPPSPTSTISANPIFLQAVRILDIVISLPNCPSIAGANIATTFLPASISFIIATMSVFEPIAPNGHLWIHCPQRIHFSSSITQMPFSSMVIALTGQTFLHGRIKSAIALYGQFFAHMPHSLHLSGSI